MLDLRLPRLNTTALTLDLPPPQTRRTAVLRRRPPVCQATTSTPSLLAPRGAGLATHITLASASATVTSDARQESLVLSSANNSPQPSNETSYEWRRQWYPIAFIKDIDTSAPYQFTLLGEPLVIWASGPPGALLWTCFVDKCPHRLVPLSEGRVNEAGLLECGYHGWAFSSSGKCEVIPQVGNTASPRACATAYPLAIRQGLLFVKPTALPSPVSRGSGTEIGNIHSDGNGVGGRASSRSKEAEEAALAAELTEVLDESGISIIPELEEGSGWAAADTWRDLPLDWRTLLENTLDASHVPFTHHKSMSNRNKIGAFDMALTTPLTENGFDGRWNTGPRAGALGPQTTIFRPPGFMLHRLGVNGRGLGTFTCVYSVPTTPGNCRLINRNGVKLPGGEGGLAYRLFKLIPDFGSHVSSHVLLEDDQIFLHKGEEIFAKERALAGRTAAQAYYCTSQADAYIVAFHRWIDKFGGGGPFGKLDEHQLSLLGPRLSRTELLDRYSQHTANCAQCKAALSKVEVAQKGASAVAWLAGAAAVLCAAVALASSNGAMSSVAALTGSAGGAAAAAATAVSTAEGWVAGMGQAVGGSLLVLARGIAGSSAEPAGLMLRALLYALLGAGSLAGRAALDDFHAKFFTGVYPPPRNASRSDA